MRKILLLLIFMGISCTVQEPPIQNQEPQSFDFGEIYSDQTLTRRFEFERKIVSVLALCDCIQAKILKIPGQKISCVEVTLHPQGYHGPIEQEILLLDSSKNQIRIRISAVVKDRPQADNVIPR